MKNLIQRALISTILIALPFAVHAETKSATSGAPSAASTSNVSTAAAAQMSEGEIRKVNKDAKKITIKHGELKNLDMPPMTMVFQVKDAGLLDKVKAGDKVSFVAEKVGGRFTVTQIEARN